MASYSVNTGPPAGGGAGLIQGGGEALLPGVSAAQSGDIHRGIQHGYSYDGNFYGSAAEANQAAAKARQQASSAGQGTYVNNGSNISNTGGPVPPNYMMGGVGAGTGFGGSGGVGGPVGGGGVGGGTYVQNGNGPLWTQQGYETQQLQKGQAQSEQDLLKERADLSGQAFKDRLNMITGNGMGAPSPVSGGGAGAPDEAQARATAFAQAKEQAGQSALSALMALKDQFAGQGMTGSTVEGNAMGGVIGQGLQGVNGFTANQLSLDLSRAKELADRNYQGNITQRGQDLAYKQALMGLMGTTLY